jgi:hypothetical protein
MRPLSFWGEGWLQSSGAVRRENAFRRPGSEAGTTKKQKRRPELGGV